MFGGRPTKNFALKTKFLFPKQKCLFQRQALCFECKKTRFKKLPFVLVISNQRWSRGHKARVQGQEHKKSKTKDRPSRGQKQECSRPRTKDTSAGVLRKKKYSKIFFRRSPKEENKKGLRKVSARFMAFINISLTIQKRVLFSSRGQGNFRGLEASRPRLRTRPSRPRTSKCVLEDKDILENSTSGKRKSYRIYIVSFFRRKKP